MDDTDSNTDADSTSEQSSESTSLSVKCGKCRRGIVGVDTGLTPSELDTLLKDPRAAAKYLCPKCKTPAGKKSDNEASSASGIPLGEKKTTLSGGGIAAACIFQPRLTLSLVLTVFSAAVGTAFLNGYNLGVTNPPEQVIKAFLNKSMTARKGSVPSEVEVTSAFAAMVSAICGGGLIGGLLVLPISQRCGRRASLMFNAVFAVSGAGCMLSARRLGYHEILIIGRVLVGIHAGISGGIAPLYFAEVSPPAWRGAVGTIYQLVVVVAILVSQIVGLRGLLGNEASWPLLLGGGVLCPVLVMLVMLPFCPESPKYLLISRNDDTGAEQALKSLRGNPDVSKELKALKAEAEKIRNNPPVKLTSILRDKILRRGFTIACVVMMSQPLSGINAAIFFSTQIFRSAGLSDSNAGLATVGMSVVNLLTTIVSFSIIERSGRRTLLLTGYFGMAVVSIVLAVALGTYHMFPWMSWVSVIGVLTFIMMFAIGPGSIPWFLPTELLPAPAQPITTGICVALNWSLNILVGMLFPLMMTLVGHNTFIIFTVLLSAFFIYICRNLPETKGRTVEEIMELFQKG